MLTQRADLERLAQVAQEAIQSQAAAPEYAKELAAQREVEQALRHVEAAQSRRDFRRDAAFADTLYRQLYNQIKKVESEVKEDERLEVYCLVAGTLLQVRDIDYQEPRLIIFYGEAGDSTALMHMASVQLLVKIVKHEKSKPQPPIGFRRPIPPGASGVSAEGTPSS